MCLVSAVSDYLATNPPPYSLYGVFIPKSMPKSGEPIPPTYSASKQS